jgi:protein-S-isoprenylcysteine O-methyltransferase Ste14
MDNTADTAQVTIRPPLAWGLAVIAGLALNWLMSLLFLPADLPIRWLGAMVFVLALALFAWAIVTITRAGSNVPTNRPTTTIVESGPYRFTRNPIYLGMFLGLIGLAIALDNLWLLMMLVPFALVIRYGVVAREEAYLERSSAMSTVVTARAYGAGCSALNGSAPGGPTAPRRCPDGAAEAAVVKQQFDSVWARVDTALTASAFF